MRHKSPQVARKQPDLLRLYATMLLIRRTEERLLKLFESGEGYGSLHLCIGQEATAAGACAALRNEDYMTATYRGHGATLAKGTSLKAFMAELMGRETGCCKGRGGSMLLTDLTVGNLGCSGIVAGAMPTAVGAGLSARLSKNDRVALTFFGEGATNQGTFHEAMNLAALWKLPCVFFCENNGYAEMTPISKEASIQRLADRGCAYDIPGMVVDGNDVEAVYDATCKAIARARAGDGPTFIEAITYRLCGHMFGDPQTYRSPKEVEEWRKRDPLIIALRKLKSRGVTDESLSRVNKEIEAEIEDAVAFARGSQEPGAEEVGA